MTGFLQNKDGDFSMGRLISYVLVMSGIVYVFIFKTLPIPAMLIGSGVSGKLLAK